MKGIPEVCTGPEVRERLRWRESSRRPALLEKSEQNDSRDVQTSERWREWEHIQNFLADHYTDFGFCSTKMPVKPGDINIYLFFFYFFYRLKMSP